MGKEYTITLQEPPATQIIRHGMVQHLNQVAQDGRHIVDVAKESGYCYSHAERDLLEDGHGQSIYRGNKYGVSGIILRMTGGRNLWL